MTRSKQTPVSKVLRRALSRVRRGWGQLPALAKNKRLVCLYTSTGSCGAWIEADQALRDTLGVDCLADWNDHPLRKKAHVEHVLKFTIARVEREAVAR